MSDNGEDWSAALTRHGAALLLLARQYVPSLADAEDVVQEALVRCWRSRQTIADPAAYLFASVRRCALDWQRGQRRRTTRELAAARPESQPLFVASWEQTERRAAIEAALRELPEPQAEVLVLRIWAGLTFPQIATALEISTNTAASRYRYALDKLRETLAEEPSYE